MTPHARPTLLTLQPEASATNKYSHPIARQKAEFSNIIYHNKRTPIPPQHTVHSRSGQPLVLDPAAVMETEPNLGWCPNSRIRLRLTFRRTNPSHPRLLHLPPTLLDTFSTQDRPIQQG